MGCGSSTPVRCPKCNYKFANSEDVLYHLEKNHNLREAGKSEGPTTTVKPISCPKCNETNFKDGQHLVKHLESRHSFLPGDTNAAKISCPKCNANGFKSTAALVKHCEETHPSAKITNNSSPTHGSGALALPGKGIKQKVAGKNVHLPQVGDKVLAMWVKSKWQYFDATIIRFVPDKLLYEIEWDDQDPSGRMVDYFNLALNKEPSEKEIGVGSVVLFHQGRYKGEAGVRLGGVRWHQGKVTRAYTGSSGVKLYDGCHTKGAADGKWVTFKGYEENFTGYSIEDFRVGPNVFDIIEDDDDNVDEEDIDIYFSYSPTDSPEAIKNKEVEKIPERYMSMLDSLCDPRIIAEQLKSKGLKVGYRKTSSNAELKRTAKMMKKAKVFIACISDEYVADNECRMEFQYAKTTLNTPVVPLVVGDGSNEWSFSVVGMLIAGELYIHFKDRNVENAKFTELVNALKSHFEAVQDATDSGTSTKVVQGEADIFVSYCWTNSFLAKQNNQTNNLVGGEFSDPRLVKQELENAGYKMWLDIERLRSANAGAGMYEQLTLALKDAKVIIPFVSMEYANSPNCRLEFQFAMKSLQKPIVPVVVGEGSAWQQSVIGALVNSNDTEVIMLQDTADQTEFRQKVKQIQDRIDQMLGSGPAPSKNSVYRAPTIGDHVVSHHFHYAYYMSTITSFNSETLEYTVDWDDGDPSGRVQSYDQVALDIVPDPDVIGVDTIVFFQQGSYGGTEGNNEGGKRYHEGVVTLVKRDGDKYTYSGHHTRGEVDGKWVTYQGYSYEFLDVPLEELRVAPSAMDALLASNN